jgi:hypothetical protein
MARGSKTLADVREPMPSFDPGMSNDRHGVMSPVKLTVLI